MGEGNPKAVAVAEGAEGSSSRQKRRRDWSNGGGCDWPPVTA